MDQFERWAAEIKANPRSYRRECPVTCRCAGQEKTIAAVYVDTFGMRWLWTTGSRAHRESYPPRAHPMTAEVAGGGPGIAICPKCRSGLVILAIEGRTMRCLRLAAPTFAVVA